jgi:hypothetical protein
MWYSRAAQPGGRHIRIEIEPRRSPPKPQMIAPECRLELEPFQVLQPGYWSSALFSWLAQEVGTSGTKGAKIETAHRWLFSLHAAAMRSRACAVLPAVMAAVQVTAAGAFVRPSLPGEVTQVMR